MPLKDIKGQGHAIQILKDSIRQDRLAHAYLFLGPKGVGKTKAALEFAKLLNCQNAGDDCCGACPSCIKIEKLIHPDVFFISRDAERTQIQIGKIRQVQERISLKPFEAKWKVVIISNAEFMNDEASNSLLKILEEPTPDTLFILTASSRKEMPETIISRCQAIRFKALTRDEVYDILIKDYLIEEKEARFLSSISGANIAMALNLKEKEAVKWKNDVIDAFLGGGYQSRPYDILVLNEKRQVHIEMMDILLGFYRDILVYKFTKDETLIINIDRIDVIAETAQHTEADKIQGYIKNIERVKTALEANVNTKLAMQVLTEALAV